MTAWFTDLIQCIAKLKVHHIKETKCNLNSALLILHKGTTVYAATDSWDAICVTFNWKKNLGALLPHSITTSSP